MKSHLRTLTVICATLFVLTLPSLPASATDSQTYPVLLISDIHFSPFPLHSIDCREVTPGDLTLVGELAQADPRKWKPVLSKYKSESNYGTDTDFSLLTAAITAMQEAMKNSRPKLIIIAGDFLTHDFGTTVKCLNERLDSSAKKISYRDLGSRTMQFLELQIRGAFQGVQILPALGNNDSDCVDDGQEGDGDYRLEPGGEFARKFAAVWKKDAYPDKAARGDPDPFAYAGYYTARVKFASHVHAVVLNSVLWSALYENKCGKQADPGADEIEWFKQVLQRWKEEDAKHHRKPNELERLWLIGHIPPGVDVYKTLKPNQAGPVPMFNPKYTKEVLDVIDSPGSRIQYGFFGHTHMNEFRIVGAGKRNIPIQMIPSISPRSHNSPAFMVLQVDKDGELRDYNVFAVDAKNPGNADHPFESAQWPLLYSLRSDLLPKLRSQGGIEGTDYYSIHLALASDEELRTRYADYYKSGSKEPGGISAGNWRAYWCAMTNLLEEDFVRCQQTDAGVPKASPIGASSSR